MIRKEISVEEAREMFPDRMKLFDIVEDRYNRATNAILDAIRNPPPQQKRTDTLRYLHHGTVIQGTLFTPGWIDAATFPWAESLAMCGDSNCACCGDPLR